MYVILIFAIIALIIFSIYLIVEKENIFGIIPLIFGVFLLTLYVVERPQRVYEKSSDMRYWERSNKQFKSDTTTIDTLYFNNRADTVYRTIHYIVTE